MKITNDEIHEIACTIYFGTNKEAQKEWRAIQDPLFSKYNITFNNGSWYTLSQEEQELALKKGKEILIKYKLEIPEKYKISLR